jgi:hypothetical protein
MSILSKYFKSSRKWLIRSFSLTQLWNPGRASIYLFEKIIDWKSPKLPINVGSCELRKKIKYKKVIIGMYRADLSSNFLDLYLYQYLKKSGIQVKVILCDGAAFPCDSIAADDNLFNYRCMQCKATQKLFGQIIEKTDVISPIPMKRSSIGPVGVNAIASAKRYDRVELSYDEKVASKFQESYQAVRNLLEHEEGVDLVIMSHGLYATWGAMRDYCKESGIDYITWGRIYFDKMLAIVKNSTINEGVSQLYSTQNINHERERDKLVNSLRKRLSRQEVLTDSVDYYSYMKNKSNNSKELLEEIKSNKKTIIAIYLSIPWDGTVYGANGEFKSQFHLIREIVDISKMHPEMLFVFRVHPRDDELREKAADQVRKLCDESVTNVMVIGAQSTLTSYDLMKIAHLNIIYCGTLALEIAYAGLPLILCGRNLVTSFAGVRTISKRKELEEVFKSDFEKYRPNADDVARSISSLAKVLYTDDLSNTENYDVTSFNNDSELIERIVEDLLCDTA